MRFKAQNRLNLKTLYLFDIIVLELKINAKLPHFKRSFF